MRQLDTFQSYLDNDGHPLIGRLRFCNKADDSPAVVRNSSGTSLGSTIYTNSAGRCVSEVYLDDKDYRIYFDRYTGETNMESDTAEESWQNIGSAVNIYNIMGINIDTKGLQAVGSIAALRALDPNLVHQETGVREVMLVGYISAGDKAPVQYKWDANCTENDNGGSYIVVTLEGQPIAGRWVMVVEGDSIDASDFGCFGNDTCIRDGGQVNKIAAAKNFCSAKGYSLTIKKAGFYDVTNLSISCKLDMGVNSYLCCNTNSDATIVDATSNVKAYAYNTMQGDITIRGNSLRSSQNVTGAESIELVPITDIVLDNDYAGVAGYADIKVFITATQSHNRSFTNCDIVSNKKLTGTASYSFFNCHIYKRMFADTYDISTYARFTNCWSSRSDWTTDNEYNAFGSQSLISATNGQFTGAVTIVGNAGVGGALTVSGGAGITGDTTIGGTAAITGTTGIGGNLTVNGDGSFNRVNSGGRVNAGSLDVSGLASVDKLQLRDLLDVSGGSVLSPKKNLLDTTRGMGNMVLVFSSSGDASFYISGTLSDPQGISAVEGGKFRLMICTYALNGSYVWRDATGQF